jgi:hypothetical protein
MEKIEAKRRTQKRISEIALENEVFSQKRRKTRERKLA